MPRINSIQNILLAMLLFLGCTSGYSQLRIFGTVDFIQNIQFEVPEQNKQLNSYSALKGFSLGISKEFKNNIQLKASYGVRNIPIKFGFLDYNDSTLLFLETSAVQFYGRMEINRYWTYKNLGFYLGLGLDVLSKDSIHDVPIKVLAHNQIINDRVSLSSAHFSYSLSAAVSLQGRRKNPVELYFKYYPFFQQYQLSNYQGFGASNFNREKLKTSYFRLGISWSILKINTK